MQIGNAPAEIISAIETTSVLVAPSIVITDYRFEGIQAVSNRRKLSTICLPRITKMHPKNSKCCRTENAETIIPRGIIIPTSSHNLGTLR